MTPIRTSLVSSRFIIVSLLSLSLVMVFVFTATLTHAATPQITAGENLTVGSEGPNVVVLQALLTETGYLNIPTGIAMGRFGGLTRDALARYQAATYVRPSVGYFGPVTKVSMYTDYAARGWLPLLGW